MLVFDRNTKKSQLSRVHQPHRNRPLLIIASSSNGFSRCSVQQKITIRLRLTLVITVSRRWRSTSKGSTKVIPQHHFRNKVLINDVTTHSFIQLKAPVWVT